MKDELDQVWFVYEDREIYDGYCATIYKDGTFELRNHWAVDRLTNEQKASLSGRILDLIHQKQKELNK